MIRRPTDTEFGVLCSWGLLAVTATVMGASSRAWLSLLWAMYGNRPWPQLTDIYLSSVHWFWIIPALSGMGIGIRWTKNLIEQFGAFIQVFFHAFSLAIFVFSSVAAVQPFLTTTFRMQQSKRTDQSTESRAFGTSRISAAEQPRMPEASGMR